MNLLEALDILGLPKDYDQETLKKKYRALAMKYHPDKNKDPSANEKFIKISEAHDFLANPPEEENIDLDFLFKAFNPFSQMFKDPIDVTLTAKEYLMGTTKYIKLNDKNIQLFLGPKINKTEILHPLIGKIKIKIEEPYYIYNGNFYCTFEISLKESLTGFTKTFKDPFDKNHIISVDKIIKTNDGYKIDDSLTIVFNVIYPNKLNKKVINSLKALDF